MTGRAGVTSVVGVTAAVRARVVKRLIVAITVFTAVAWAVLWLGEITTPAHIINDARSRVPPISTPIPTPAHTRPPPSYSP